MRIEDTSAKSAIVDAPVLPRPNNASKNRGPRIEIRATGSGDLLVPRYGSEEIAQDRVSQLLIARVEAAIPDSLLQRCNPLLANVRQAGQLSLEILNSTLAG
jgi:hypothetical protein